ncbi:UbiE/COQ5 family methyltransferase [Zalerion maritima]|uniref:UbiE/COQ5 family methyltransferase n=1 Tax=Zalerion maritima TaxID=339359 RepID=A0AAD5WRX0_9PEZI|nr:UbiE/COQ5 family methyltransferase [Zalerion maritima]
MASKFWDSTARKYASRPVSNEGAYAQTLSSVRSRLTPASRILEVGCGTGSTVLKLAPFCASVHGTDFSKEMVAICNEKLSQAKAGGGGSEGVGAKDTPVKKGLDHVSFSTLDVCTPLPETSPLRASQDTVLAFNLLYLLPSLPVALCNINTMLTPGGLFISKNMVSDRMSFTYKILGKVVPVMALVGLAPPGGIKFQTADELESSMKGAGFEIVESKFPEGDEMRRYVVAKKVREMEEEKEH